MPSISPAATSGKFDTSQFNATGNAKNPVQDPAEILAYKRGMDWLLREMPMMEAFIRAWTNKNVRLTVGPIPCTDGDTIYLAPQPLYTDDEPSQLYLAHMWHEVAHVILSQVYEPANSRKPEDSLKMIGNAAYGQPADFLWNAIEDGRVEDRLYKTAPGARKHIIKDVINVSPKIVENCKKIGTDFGIEHLLQSCEPVGLAALQMQGSAVIADPSLSQAERQQKLSDIGEAILEHARQTGDLQRAAEISSNTAADIGLLMSTYLETAGYRDEARLFEQRVIDALEDPVIATAIVESKKLEKSLPVLHVSTRIILARARELGFFADWDPRALNPDTGEPNVIDWNTLSDAEKDAIRQQLKNQQGMPRLPGQNEAVVVNLPKELMDELRKQMQNGMPQPGQGQPQPGQGKQGEQSNDNHGSSGNSDRGAEAQSQPGGLGSDASGNPVDALDEHPKSDGSDAARADAKAFAEADKDAPVSGSGSGSDQRSSTERVPGSDSSSSSVSDEAEESDGLDRIKQGGGDRDNRYEAPAELKEAYANKEAEKGSSKTAQDEPKASGTPSDSSSSSGTASDAPTSSGEQEDEEVEFEGTETASSDREDRNGSSSAQSGAEWSEDDEAKAIEQHIMNEEARLKRIEKFRNKFSEIEDTIRPPHIEYVTKDEAKELEAKSDKAQTIKEAMQMEVGEISGSPENKFLFKQRAMKISEKEAEAAPNLDKYNDVLAGEANRLRAIFKSNEKSGFSGQFEIGSHIAGRHLPGFIMGEHLKPFDRRYVPKKLSYSVTLLIDQSGSMSGDKIVMARTALAMQATLLDKLGIPFEILGFSTRASGGGGYINGHWDYKYLVQHDVFKSFDEGWTPVQRAKVMSITTNDSNLDGLALSWAWDRMQKRKEKVKILMTYSDGQPNPDTANQIAVMKHVIKKMTLQGAVAIGVGILSHAPEQLYPKSVYCSDVRTLPRLVTKALEEEIAKSSKR